MEVNYFAVLVMTVFAIALGSVWYGPLFGRLWMQFMGAMDAKGSMLISKEEMKRKQQQMGPWYAIQAVLSFVTMWVLASVVAMWPAHHGLLAAFTMWLGFVMPTVGSGLIWDEMGSKERLQRFGITATYQLILLLISGYLFTIWK